MSLRMFGNLVSSFVELANDTWIRARNAADTGWINMFKVNTDDEIETGAILNTDYAVTLAQLVWLRANSFVGTGYINMFQANADDEINVGGTMNSGPIEGPEDGGAITLYDMPVSATPVAGTEQSASMRIDGDNIIKMYAEADSAGGIQNERVELLDEVMITKASVQTTDATVTTCGDVTLEDTAAYYIETTVIGRETDGTNRNLYHLEGLFYREGGNATQQGATTSITTVESDGAWACVFDVSTNDVRVRVTGAAATIDWKTTIKYIKV